jgi:hypothetical protein
MKKKEINTNNNLITINNISNNTRIPGSNHKEIHIPIITREDREILTCHGLERKNPIILRDYDDLMIHKRS